MFNDYMGVFEKIEDAIDASIAAQKELMAKFTTEDRQRMIDNIKRPLWNTWKRSARWSMRRPVTAVMRIRS